MKRTRPHSRKLPTMLLVCGSLCASLAIAEPPIDSRFDATISPFIGYDTNAALISEDAFANDAESLSGGVTVTAGYRLYRDADTELRVGLNGFLLLNTDLANFDVTALRPALSFRQSMSIASRPATLTARLGFESVQLSGDDLNQSQSVQLAAGLSVFLSDTISVGGSLQVAETDFDADGFDPAITSRDTSRVTPSVFLAYRWPTTRTRLTVTLDFVGNDADGSDFEYDALGYAVAIEQPFDTRFGLLRTKVGARLVDRDYDKFSASPQRQQDIFEINSSVGLQLRRNLNAFANVSFTDSDASINAFSYDRVRTGLGLSWSF